MKNKNVSLTQPDELPVIPLWIGGHAYLTITEVFATVRRASDAEPLRRVPLCSTREVGTALRSAREALPLWSTLPMTTRLQFLAEVGKTLSDHASHFAGLIQEETNIPLPEAEAEVAMAIDCLHDRHTANDGLNAAPEAIALPPTAGTIAIACGTRPHPLSGFLRLAAPAWQAGHVVIARASADAPSTLFALAELTARCHWPAGTFCLLYGDATTDAALKAENCPVEQA